MRSARQSDLDLLPQFGRPAFAWSGATPHLVPFIERAPIADLYALQVSGYYRIPPGSRRENLYANPRTLLKRGAEREQGPRHRVPVRRPQPCRRAGHRVVLGEVPGGVLHLPLVGQGEAVAGLDRRRARQATEGGQLGGATVIIQYIHIATSRFEEYGGLPPLARSIGSGTAVILRNGRAYTVHWSRPDLNSGTTFTLPGGKRMLFAPGQVWVVLAPESPASYVNAARV